MLARFSNEVLSKGPAAVLPQNLNDKWLKRLQEVAEEFLDSNFSLDECNNPRDIADPILTTCVYEILRNQVKDIDDIPLEEMLEKIVVYALSITMEAVHRESPIGIDPPDLENILSPDRIIAFKAMNADFIRLLENACIIGKQTGS